MKSILQIFSAGGTGASSESYAEAQRIASSEFGELVAAIPDEGADIAVWLDTCAMAIFEASCRFRMYSVDEDIDLGVLTTYEQGQIERLMAAYIIRQTELARQLWPMLEPDEPYPDWDTPGEVAQLIASRSTQGTGAKPGTGPEVQCQDCRFPFRREGDGDPHNHRKCTNCCLGCVRPVAHE